MFIVNQHGRIVDLPESMEEEGFRQAKEVLSISDSLMESGKYVQTTAKGILNSKSGEHLRDEILSKFPKVMKDSEYIDKIINKKDDKPRNDSKSKKVHSTR